MPTIKVAVCFGISLLFLTVLGISLNREFQNYQNTESALREIVLNDATAAERFLASDAVSQTNWKEYLDISSLTSNVEEYSQTSREKLDSALVTLKFAYGLDKYPVLLRLRESLGALMAWNETTPFVTLFQKATASEIYAESRRNGSELDEYSPAPTIPETVDAEIQNEVQIVQNVEEETPAVSEANVSFSSATELFEEESRSMTANMPLTTGNSLLASKHSEEAEPQIGRGVLLSSEKENLFSKEEKSVEIPVKKMETANALPLEEKKTELFAKVNSLSEISRGKSETSIPEAKIAQTAQTDESDEKTASAEETAPAFFPELPKRHFTLSDRLKQTADMDASGTALNINEPSEKMTGDFSADSAVLANAWLGAQYVAPEEKDLDAAYVEIKNATRSLDQLFQKAGAAKAKSWRDFLKWDEWKQNSSDPVVLNALYRRLSCGAYGLELNYFVNLRKAIAHYLAIKNQSLDFKSAEERFQTGKNDLAKLIVMFRESPDSTIQNAIKDMLDWMATMGQSPELVQLTRELWKNPNMIMHIDGKLFERLGTQEMERTETTADNISSATVRSTSQFKGILNVKPVANEKQAEMSIELAGTADSRSNAYAKSVVVSSTAKSQVKAVKTIRFGEDGFETDSTKVSIQTNSKINDISDVHNRRVVEHAATRRVYAQKPSTERQARAQSARRLQKQLDGPIDQALTAVNEKMAEMIYQQLGPRGVQLEEIRTSSGEKGVHVQGRLVCRDGMGAYAMPENVETKSDIYFAIHESALQELFIGFLDGVNLNESARRQFKALSPNWVREVLNRRQESGENADWSICFAQNWPITVSFNEGRIVCRIHCEKIINEGKEYPALDATIAYDVKVDGGKLVMKRHGEIEILPPDFNPAEGKRLPGSIVSLRRIMAKRLQNAFKPEFVVEERALVSEPNEQNKRFADLYVQPAFIQAKNGWLQIGANIVEKKR